MVRYSHLLQSGYTEAGEAVRMIQPSTTISSRVRSGALRKLLAYVENLVVFPLVAIGAARDADLIHVADHSNALWLLGPLGRRPAVVTCHDLVAVRAAAGEIPGVAIRATGRLYQRAVAAGLRRATVIACVSEATAADVRRIVRPDGVRVLVNPVAPDLLPNPDGLEPERRPAALVVSTVGYRKRREHAVRIWQRMRGEGGLDRLALRIVGPGLTGEEAALLAPDEAGEVEVLSDIDDATLACEYASAAMVIQASLYEGFGWPILEGNVHGTPALCADIPVFREVAGAAGTFVGEDLDAVDWPAIVASVTADDAMARAAANVQRFSWEDFTEGLRGLAESVVSVHDAEPDLI